MKDLYRVFLILLPAILATGALYSQPSYDLQFRLEQNEATANGIYEVTARIKANESAFELGSCNLVFTYNPAALASPAPIGPGPDSLGIEAIHNFSGGDYAKMTLTKPAPGMLSLNIELLDPDNGATVPMSFVDIATIRFSIVNPAEPSNLVWRTDSPNPVVLFQNDEATLLDHNTLRPEVLLANLKVFLEGPYSGGSMSTTLNSSGYLPLSQPFNTAPWNYPGSESVAGIPAGVVDWVLVQIRSDATTEEASRAGFLTSNGMIVDLNGTSPVTFDVPDNNYYMVVYHRNHLAIMSAAQMGLNKAAVEAEYNFTTGQAQAYGTNPMVELGTGSGVYGLVGGETNLSGIITNADKTPIINELNSVGYYYSDTNLSGIVTNADKSLIISNLNKVTQVPASTMAPGREPKPAALTNFKNRQQGDHEKPKTAAPKRSTKAEQE